MSRVSRLLGRGNFPLSSWLLFFLLYLISFGSLFSSSSSALLFIISRRSFFTNFQQVDPRVLSIRYDKEQQKKKIVIYEVSLFSVKSSKLKKVGSLRRGGNRRTKNKTIRYDTIQYVTLRYVTLRIIIITVHHYVSVTSIRKWETS
jgi:hypothetical protein